MNRFISLVIIAVALTGCDPSSDNSPPQTGRYEGSLIRRSGGKLTEISVKADVTHPDSKVWKLDVQNLDGSSIEQDTLTTKNGTQAELTVPSLGVPPITVSAQADCLGATGTFQTRVCQQTAAFLIEVRDSNGAVYSLSLEQFQNNIPRPQETPTAFTLDDSMKHAFTMSFETRAQFERTMEATHVAQNAYGNLLPHLNINTGVGIAQSLVDWTQLIGLIGDLAPFLLPTRWIQAHNATTQTDAEKIALVIMRGDSGLVVESLTYAWERDQAILEDYKKIVADSQKLAAQIRSSELMGQYPVGTADSIQTSVNAMMMDLSNLQAAADTEKSTFAQAMGFVSPDAVISVSTGTIPDEPELDQLDEPTLEDTVIHRSLELGQMDKLIEIAMRSKTATYFEWLDPSGNPNASLGAGLPSAIAIAQDKQDEILLQKTTLESTMRQKSRSALAQYRTAKNQADLAQSDRSLQEKRLARILETIKYGKDTNSLELVTVYQDLLRSIINEHNTQTEIQISRAKLDRLRLEGYYSALNFAGSGPSP